MTMTYPKNVLDSGTRIINENGNIININTQHESGFTKMMNQSQGVQHSAKYSSILDNLSTRNMLIMQILPNVENRFVNVNKPYLERKD